MRTKCILFCWSALLTLTLAAVPAVYAAEPSARTIFTAEYQHGREALKARDWQKGYDIFSALWEKSKTFDVAINLGQAELKLSKLRDAAEHLAFGIRNAPADSVDSAEAAKLGLEKASKGIGRLKIQVIDGTEVLINGRAIGVAPLPEDVFVEPGSTHVSGRHPSQGEGDIQLVIAAGEAQNVELALRQTPVTAASPPPNATERLDAPSDVRSGTVRSDSPQPRPAEKPKGTDGRTIVLVAGGAVTAIAAGTALVFGLKARAAKNDAETMIDESRATYGADGCSSPGARGAGSCSAIQSKFEERSDAARVYNFMLPAAGIAALATGALYLALPRRSTASAHDVTLTPLAERRGGGLLFQGSF